MRATPLFVKREFADRYDLWLQRLGDEARAIMYSEIDTGAWYPLSAGMIEPTRVACELFFGGDDRGAWQIGRFSADYSLWGLYRLFVRIGSPLHLIKRATEAFGTYYRPSRLVVADSGPNHAVARIELFPDPNVLVEYRIAGWMERGLEISGCREVDVKITRSLCLGDSCTEIVGRWC